LEIMKVCDMVREETWEIHSGLSNNSLESFTMEFTLYPERALKVFKG
jgi:hypothetical protein